MTNFSDSPFWKSISDFLFEKQPKGVGWTHIFGSSLLWLFFIQMVTGGLMAIYYSPSPENALASIRYIEEQVAFGSFLRGVHHWAASLFVIIIFLHLLRTFLWGAYKKPRHWTWTAGVMLLLLILGMAFTGYLLPWDMKGYFATKVGIEVGGLVPVIGSAVMRILQGGTEMGIKTLNRFYIWHILWIPAGILLLMGTHLYFIRNRGIAPPGKRTDEPGEPDKPFFPYQAWKDFAGMAVVTVVLILIAVVFGAPVGEMADPNSTSFVPRPDWYFYWLFELLRIFEGQFEVIGGVILPGILMMALLFLPWYDKNPERTLKHRPVSLAMGIALPLVVGALTLWGWQSGRSLEQQYASSQQEPDWYTVAEPANGDLMDAGLYDLYLPLRCGTCHDVEAEGINSPPSLYGAGDRYQRAWLQEYVISPYRRRFEDDGVRPTIRMPEYHLSSTEAQQIAAFLSGETGEFDLLEPGIDWTVRDTAKIAEGRMLFQQYQCNSCHQIQGEGGEIGPSLDGAGTRLKPDWIYTFVGDAREIIPGTPMRNYDLWESEREALTFYLLSQRGEN